MPRTSCTCACMIAAGQQGLPASPQYTAPVCDLAVPALTLWYALRVVHYMPSLHKLPPTSLVTHWPQRKRTMSFRIRNQ